MKNLFFKGKHEWSDIQLVFKSDKIYFSVFMCRGKPIKHGLLKTIHLAVRCYQNVWCSLVTFRIWSRHLLSNRTKLHEVSNTCLLQARLLCPIYLLSPAKKKTPIQMHWFFCFFCLRGDHWTQTGFTFPVTPCYRCFKGSLLGMLSKKAEIKQCEGPGLGEVGLRQGGEGQLTAGPSSAL